MSDEGQTFDGHILPREVGSAFHRRPPPVRSDDADAIDCWMLDTDYSGEAFFARQVYFPGKEDVYKAFKVFLKNDIDEEEWESVAKTTSRPFPRPKSGQIAVKVINHFGDEVMKVFEVG